jgi:hypothetical protein
MTSSLAAGSEAKNKRIRVLYSLHAGVQPRPDWPNIGFDFNPVMERMTAALEAGCPGIEFIPTMAKDESQAKAILEKDKTSNIDGYVVMQMNCWNRVVQPMIKSGKPVLYADFLYAGSGGFLVYTAGFIRQKTPNFGFICSSQFSDVVEAAKCFSTVKKADQFAQAVAKVRKAQTQEPSSQICKPDKLELLSASKWQEKMKKSKILTVGGKGWRGPKSVIEELGVQVIEIPYAEINEAWKVADKDKSKEIADMWVNRAVKVVGVPQETLETSAAMYLGLNAVLKKHRADGVTINCLGGQGASLRSLLPTGYMTTTVEFGAFQKELLIHRGKAVDNIIEDRACRTKLAVEPDGDIEKLFTQWDRYGWHRVTVYGDLKEPLFEIAKMLKWKVVEEA